MIFSRELSCCQLPASCIAIGSFDGVHLGHQVLIREMIASARAQGISSVVINFYPQPIVVFRQLERDFYISEIEERKTLIEDLGTDYLITIPFTRELGQMSADEFLEQLKDSFGMKELWVGEDFALGKGRSGDVPYIKNLGEKMNFNVYAIERVRLNGEDISSSAIREALRDGDMIRAGQLLGRPFMIRGPVIHGAKRGRTIGYPTANVAVDPLRIALREGVYWTRLTVDGVTYPAATSVGTNPTFVHLENPPVSVETYILDFDEDIYDKMVQIEFRAFIRDQVVYNSVEALISQIAHDVEVVRGFEQDVNAKTANLLTRSPKTQS